MLKWLFGSAEPPTPVRTWENDYKVGDRFTYLGVELLMTEFLWDVDIGVYGICCDYLDKEGRIRGRSFTVAELPNLTRI
jgi:hypothetical protein